MDSLKSSLFGWFSSQADLKGKKDYFATLPNEMIEKIFDHLDNPSDLKHVRLGCKKWSEVVSHQKVKETLKDAILADAFGVKQWGELGVEVADIPLPKGIYKLLASPCPIWEQKQENEKNTDDFTLIVPKVKDTHMLILMPRGLTLKQLGEHAQKCFPNISTMVESRNSSHQDREIMQSYWLLFTKDVLPGSKGQRFDKQKELVTNLARKTFIEYKEPKALEAAVYIFSKYLNSDINPLTEVYTHCESEIHNPLTVGCRMHEGSFIATSPGFNLFFDDDDQSRYLSKTGIAAVRRL